MLNHLKIKDINERAIIDSSNSKESNLQLLADSLYENLGNAEYLEERKENEV